MRQIDRIYIQTLFAIIASLLFFWSAALLAGQITVAWDATPDPAVGGYKLYYRQIGQNYSDVDVGYQTTFTLFGLENGKVFCIAAAAYNIARTFESGLSNEACKQLPPAFQDMNGDGTADLAGLSSAGQIFYTLDRPPGPTSPRSLWERQRDWGIALQMVGQRPFLGTGPDHYLAAAQAIGPAAETVHNVPLLVAAELGLLGLVLWLVFCLWPLGKYGRSALHRGATAVWLALIVMALLHPEPTLFLPKGAVLWAIAAAQWPGGTA